MKKTLLCTVSAITLSSGLATGAMAFEKVDWDWKLDADTDIKVDVDVDIKVDPNGAVIVEIDQDFKGDVDAKAVVIGVINDPGDGPKGNHKWDWKGHNDALDGATQLPAVENLAAALGNSASITSEYSVQAHIDQNVSGDGRGYCRGYYCYGGGAAEITADAATAIVVNATVENTAQAIANNASITLDPYSQDEAFLMADITQWAHANVSASALTAGVFISGYNNLGLDTLGRAIVDNTAIAAGNVANITLVNGLDLNDDGTP